MRCRAMTALPHEWRRCRRGTPAADGGDAGSVLPLSSKPRIKVGLGFDLSRGLRVIAGPDAAYVRAATFGPEPDLPPVGPCTTLAVAPRRQVTLPAPAPFVGAESAASTPAVHCYRVISDPAFIAERAQQAYATGRWDVAGGLLPQLIRLTPERCRAPWVPVG
ncbi:MAG: hypothetical protein IPL59_16760 [Candidatus Competibacteraceae bacterium]|nr:hypothetical protein [Candidatus Competibacteraceae bacterium]